MKRYIAVEIISLLFIVLFVYAAAIKLLDIEKFQVQLEQSPLLMVFAPTAAWAVPVTELVITALLSFRHTRLLGLIASFTIMVIFSMYIIVLIGFAEHVPCSCGGILGKMSHESHLAFNVTFVIISAVAIVLHTKKGTHKAAGNFKYV